jgi:hypothetical protein
VHCNTVNYYSITGRSRTVEAETCFDGNGQ